MLVVFARSVILFIIVFIAIRLMGKRELSKIQPYELAIIIMISDLASGPMSSRDMSIFSGVIPILALLIVYLILTLIIQSKREVEKVICGSPSLVIFKGKLMEEELKKQQITVEEIMTQLRDKDIFKIQDTAYAILETNGKLSCMKISDVCGQMPLNVVSQGEYLIDNLKILNMTVEEVDKILKMFDVKKEQLLVGTIDELGRFKYQLKEEI